MEKEAYHPPSDSASGNGNGQEQTQSSSESTDFKAVEIWIRKGEVRLEAPESFWKDKLYALGLMELCKEIIMTAKLPKAKPEKQIITKPHGVMDFVRGLGRKK